MSRTPTRAARATRNLHHGRRSPAVTLDPLWVDETTFTLAQIRRARDGGGRHRARALTP